MKKILLTIFAITAIVACDKDAYDQDVANINVLEQAEEINATVDYDTSIVFDIINNIDGLTDAIHSKSEFKGNSNLTARTSTAADCHDNRPAATSGNSRLDVQFLPDASGNLGYSIIRGNDDIPLLLNRNFVRFSIPATGDISLELFVQGADGNFGAAIPLGDIGPEPGLSTLAGLPSFLDIDRVNNFFASQTPSVTETPADAGIDCIGLLYEVTPAPFPLNGFLATIIQGANLGGFSGSSANYAGTTEAAVRQAIENDIMN